MKQANLATKADIDKFVEEADFDNKLKYLNKKILQIKQEKYWFKWTGEAIKKSWSNINKRINEF